jgi:glycerophosphoryl diester phosphodiesterase
LRFIFSASAKLPRKFSVANPFVFATVTYCRTRKIKIVPWTVNEIVDFERMKKFDLDGIITDYPDRAVKIYRK